MKDNNCIFCKLANGEIPTATIYEDEDFRVILDANPAAKGHALILPKEHYANLYELDDELAGKSMILAKKMITKLTKALDCSPKTQLFSIRTSKSTSSTLRVMLTSAVR